MSRSLHVFPPTEGFVSNKSENGGEIKLLYSTIVIICTLIILQKLNGRIALIAPPNSRFGNGRHYLPSETPRTLSRLSVSLVVSYHEIILRRKLIALTLYLLGILLVRRPREDAEEGKSRIDPLAGRSSHPY